MPRARTGEKTKQGFPPATECHEPKRTFTIALEHDPEERVYTVSVPALPGCRTWGRTRKEALTHIRDATKGFLASMDESGDPIPPDVEIEHMTVSLPRPRGSGGAIREDEAAGRLGMSKEQGPRKAEKFWMLADFFRDRAGTRWRPDAIRFERRFRWIAGGQLWSVQCLIGEGFRGLEADIMILPRRPVIRRGASRRQKLGEAFDRLSGAMRKLGYEDVWQTGMPGPEPGAHFTRRLIDRASVERAFGQLDRLDLNGLLRRGGSR